MRLTKYHKDAIVRSVMDNVPHVQWPTAEELQAKLIKAMSAPVRRLYAVNPKALATKRQYVHGADGYDTWKWLVVGDADSDAIMKPYNDAGEACVALMTKVRNAVYGCTTRKQLVARYPEFEKFAPGETTGGDRTVPVVTGLLTDLKAAGWNP